MRLPEEPILTFTGIVYKGEMYKLGQVQQSNPAHGVISEILFISEASYSVYFKSGYFMVLHDCDYSFGIKK